MYPVIDLVLLSGVLLRVDLMVLSFCNVLKNFRSVSVIAPHSPLRINSYYLPNERGSPH